MFADARLSLARLCALTGRYDEAVAWFAEARLEPGGTWASDRSSPRPTTTKR